MNMDCVLIPSLDATCYSALCLNVFIQSNGDFREAEVRVRSSAVRQYGNATPNCTQRPNAAVLPR